MKSTYGTMYYVNNMNESVAFYKSLGLSVAHESADWTEFAIGGHNLCLHIKRPNEKYTDNGVLIIKNDGIKSLFEKMKNDGLNVFGLHEIHPNGWSFHIKDKNNNELSFYGTP